MPTIQSPYRKRNPSRSSRPEINHQQTEPPWVKTMLDYVARILPDVHPARAHMDKTKRLTLVWEKAGNPKQHHNYTDGQRKKRLEIKFPEGAAPGDPGLATRVRYEDGKPPSVKEEQNVRLHDLREEIRDMCPWQPRQWEPTGYVKVDGPWEIAVQAPTVEKPLRRGWLRWEVRKNGEMIKSGLADGWLEAMRRAEKARNEISRTRKQETSRTDRLQSAQANQELGQTKETLFPELRFRNAFPSLNDHSMFVSHIGLPGTDKDILIRKDTDKKWTIGETECEDLVSAVCAARNILNDRYRKYQEHDPTIREFAPPGASPAPPPVNDIETFLNPGRKQRQPGNKTTTKSERTT